MKALKLVLILVLSAGICWAQGSSASVQQNSAGNLAEVTQLVPGQTANVNQWGTNWAQVLQQGGSGNQANIDQGYSGHNITDFHVQGYPADYTNEGAFIFQTGAGNYGDIDILQNSAAARIQQIGNSNAGTQYVNSASAYAHATEPWFAIDIYQEGSSNSAIQTSLSSFGCYGIQSMWLQQYGSSNISNQLSVGGMAVKMHGTYTGSFNNASAVNVSATGLANPLGYAWSYAPGSATQYSYTRFSNAIIEVNGSSNNVAQYQNYSVWSTSGDHDAFANITGDYNNVAQGQIGETNSSDVDILGSDNVAATGQNGNLNVAAVNVSGSYNVAGVEQNGNSNSADIDQLSSSNAANLLQNSGGNTAVVMQKTGNANIVNLTQSSGADADILQDGAENTVMGLGSSTMATSLLGSQLNVGQVGSFNMLHLNQTNAASAIVNQVGNSNNAIVNQQ